MVAVPDTIARRGIAIGAVGLLAAMMWPAISPNEIDSLPLSNYPMFARERPRESRIDTAVAVRADSTRVRLRAADVGGTDQPVQAFRTVQQAIRTDAVDELCAEPATAPSERTRNQSGRIANFAIPLDSFRPADATVAPGCRGHVLPLLGPRRSGGPEVAQRFVDEQLKDSGRSRSPYWSRRRCYSTSC